MMKVSEYITRVLIKKGVKKIFGYTGGSIADLIDSVCLSNQINFIQLYHEQSAGYAANAYAQASGELGVAISSSGPGAINLINGIANAYYDSLPCLFITGNVHSFSKKNADGVRQNAFQETDIIKMVSGITKYSVGIKTEDEIEYCLNKAIREALSGRKGPTLIDIPYDILRKDIKINEDVISIKQEECELFDCDELIAEIIEKINNSKYPLLLLGGGAIDAREYIRTFVDNTNIPVVTSLRGRDVVCSNYDYGFIGSYGNRCANMAIYNCDLLIVAGSRLDERQMGFKRSEFAPNAFVIRIDIDITELNHNIKPDIAICELAEKVFAALISKKLPDKKSKWNELLDKWKHRYRFCNDQTPMANVFVAFLSNHICENKIVIADVGQNQMSVAQSMTLNNEDYFLCSAGLGGMGYSLPAAIGAYYAHPDKMILSFNGDGGIQMNIQELQVVNREKLPLKIIIFNNQSLGLIRNLQDRLFSGRYFASINGYSEPDFNKIAFAYDLEYTLVKNEKDYEKALMMIENDGACIIEVRIPNNQNVYPEPGNKIYIQNPPLSEKEYKLIEQELRGIGINNIMS